MPGSISCSKDNARFPHLFLRGVQAFKFWKHDSELWVWGDGLGICPQLEGGFGSMHAMLPNWVQKMGAKNGPKTKSLTEVKWIQIDHFKKPAKSNQKILAYITT